MIDGVEIVRTVQERMGSEIVETRVPKASRAFIRVKAGAADKAVRFAALELGLSHLITITAADVGMEFEVNYHMVSGGSAVLTLSVRVPKDAGAVPTVSDIMPNASLYEREAQEMTGVRFEGLQEGSLLLLPEGWPKEVHPLTKDQTFEGLKGVKLDLKKG